MSILSKTWTLIKENPWKFFLGSSSTVILTVAGIFFSDIRYVHNADIQQFKDETLLVIQDLQAKIAEIAGSISEAEEEK